MKWIAIFYNLWNGWLFFVIESGILHWNLFFVFAQNRSFVTAWRKCGWTVKSTLYLCDAQNHEFLIMGEDLLVIYIFLPHIKPVETVSDIWKPKKSSSLYIYRLWPLAYFEIHPATDASITWQSCAIHSLSFVPFSVHLMT